MSSPGEVGRIPHGSPRLVQKLCIQRTTRIMTTNYGSQMEPPLELSVSPTSTRTLTNQAIQLLLCRSVMGRRWHLFRIGQRQAKYGSPMARVPALFETVRRVLKSIISLLLVRPFTIRVLKIAVRTQVCATFCTHQMGQVRQSCTSKRMRASAFRI